MFHTWGCFESTMIANGPCPAQGFFLVKRSFSLPVYLGVALIPVLCHCADPFINFSLTLFIIKIDSRKPEANKQQWQGNGCV